MVESLGKKLEAARVKKKMTIEDVARATKIRPNAISDLERDDYSNFPSLAYAKGFVVLYAKFLGVDTGEISNVFGTPNEFGVSDYEYLSHTDESEGATPHRPAQERSRSGTKALLIIFAILLVVAGIGCGMIYLGAMYLRVTQHKDNVASAFASSVTPSASPLAAPAAAPTPKINSALAEKTPEVRRAEPIVATPVPTPVSVVLPTPTPTPAPTATPTPSPEKIEGHEVRRAEPVSR